MVDHIYKMPVIKTGPFQIPVFSGKSEWFNQMKCGSDDCTSSCNTARVLRDFRSMENNMETLHKIPLSSIVYIFDLKSRSTEVSSVIDFSLYLCYKS